MTKPVVIQLSEIPDEFAAAFAPLSKEAEADFSDALDRAYVRVVEIIRGQRQRTDPDAYMLREA